MSMLTSATSTVQPLDLSATTSVQSGLFHTDRQAFKQQLIDGLMALPEYYSLVAIRLDAKGNPTKAPSGNEWQKTEFSRESITNQILAGKASGIGIKLGKPSGGIVALDIDGLVAQKALADILGGDSLPQTVSMTSGKPGCTQYLFMVPLDIQAELTPKKETHVNAAAAKGEDLDFRWNGNQSLLPPSAHPETSGYYWVEGCSYDETEIAVLPDKLLAHWLTLMNPVKIDRPKAKGTDTRKPNPSNTLSPPSGKNKGDFERRLAAAVAKVANCLAGGRNNMLNNEVGTLVGLFPDRDEEIQATMREAAEKCGLDLPEIEATLKSATKFGLENPLCAHVSEQLEKLPALYAADLLVSEVLTNIEFDTHLNS
jgi:Bifunctional DNA primase/polymerase, N-terminal